MKISDLERKLKAKADEARNLKVRQAGPVVGGTVEFEALVRKTEIYYLGSMASGKQNESYCIIWYILGL